MSRTHITDLPPIRRLALRWAFADYCLDARLAVSASGGPPAAVAVAAARYGESRRLLHLERQAVDSEPEGLAWKADSLRMNDELRQKEQELLRQYRVVVAELDEKISQAYEQIIRDSGAPSWMQFRRLRASCSLEARSGLNWSPMSMVARTPSLSQFLEDAPNFRECVDHERRRREKNWTTNQPLPASPIR